jgi:hypothetical protein
MKKRTSAQIDKYITLNIKNKTYHEIGDELGMTPEAIRSRCKKLDLRRNKVANPNKNNFRKFLSTAKTEREILKKFKTLDLLKEKFEGYTLYTQRNLYNELVYILLPLIQEEQIKIKPRNFEYHIGQGQDGTPDPYILCKLPNFKGDIKIALLYDVHYGNFAHKKEKFLSYLEWIKETPNVYAILGGDLMENALDDGRGMSYDQNKPPITQFDEMAQLLAPIAHKILCSTTGNHENRTYKKTGIDVMKLLCDKLKIPYFSGSIWLSILANTYKWNLWVSHGWSSSRTKGGKMNSANRPKNFTGLIHFYVSGHVHDRVCESETSLTDDPINCRLMEMKQWTIVAPSFLGWKETYAYRAGYPPPASGGVSIELLDNGDYRGSLT